jgi:hypothetical protein
LMLMRLIAVAKMAGRRFGEEDCCENGGKLIWRIWLWGNGGKMSQYLIAANCLEK